MGYDEGCSTAHQTLHRLHDPVRRLTPVETVTTLALDALQGFCQVSLNEKLPGLPKPSFIQEDPFGF